MLAAVDRTVAQVEFDDPVVRGQRLRREHVEDAGGEPLITATAQGRVRHLIADEALGVDPRTSRRQTDQDRLETHPVRDSRAVIKTGGKYEQVCILQNWKRIRHRARKIHPVF